MKNFQRFLESTLLSATMNEQEVNSLVREAIEEQYVGVCVPPFWVKKVNRELQEQDIQLVTVIGFPFGYTDTRTKVFETKEVISQGADELDLVWSQTAFHSGMNWPKIEIAQISKICHEEGKILKVIIETANLTKDQIRDACLICQDAGADFVKTSTGFAFAGAQIEDIQIMRSTLSSNVGIKASGGIKTFDFAKQLIQAGADRIGTSSAKKLLEEWRSLRL